MITKIKKAYTLQRHCEGEEMAQEATKPISEGQLLDKGREQFLVRAEDLRLKPKTLKYATDMEAFAQGFITAGQLSGTLSNDTVQRIQFFCMCGRLNEFFGEKKG